MTAPSAGRTDPPGTGWAGAGWRYAIPEIVIAALIVVAAAVAGYALAGPGAVAVVAVACAAGSLAVLRGLLMPAALPPASDDRGGPDPAVPTPALSSFSGTWRQRSRLADAQASMPAYEAGLRPQLERLLASRLAERHGISLYEDPAAARRVFAGGSPANDRLWPWIDPARPAAPPGGTPPAAGTAQAGAGAPPGDITSCGGTAGRSGTGQPGSARDQPGIPYRTLAHLIDRLERL